jgi:hypothetical protein
LICCYRSKNEWRFTKLMTKKVAIKIILVAPTAKTQLDL